jgi:DNA-binding HxlR family transcriptional regulator
VLPSTYVDENCSIARTLELVGERWTLLIIRQALLGTRRFDEFQSELGIARNVLSTRLERLVEAGILRRSLYEERPRRYEYRLTKKGTDLWPVLMAMLQWGDRYEAPEGPPVVIEHRDCGGELDDRRRCRRCGQELEAWQVVRVPGPGWSGGRASDGEALGTPRVPAAH